MQPSSPRRDRTSAALRIIAGLLIVGALHFGRDILLPLALAMLLSFALAPLARRLERFGLHPVASVIVTVSLSFVALGGIGWVVADQLLGLVADLPEHSENLKQRFRDLREGGSAAIEKATELVKDFQEEMVEPEAAEEAGEGEAERGRRSTSSHTDDRLARLEELLATEEPLPVKIDEGVRSAFELVPDVVGPLLGPLSKAAVVVVFVVFLLLQRRDVGERLIRVAGEDRVDISLQAIDEAGGRISRYLVVHLALNATYAIPVTIGLWLIGVPGALFWGMLALLLRFIPYVGPWTCASLPVLLSLAVFDGWARPLGVIGLFVGIELFMNNVMEPWLYGASTGMSTVAVLFAVVFWGWLWGGAGLLLAVPLTVCLVVLGRHVPALEIFAILLGREPALSPAARFYQRVLSMEEDAAMEMAHERLRSDGLLSLYDDVVLPALHLAERDRHAGQIDPERALLVSEYLRALIDEIGEWRPPQDADAERAPEAGESRPIVCLPARDDGDELAAHMLAHLLTCEGLASPRVISVAHLAGEMVEVVRELDPALVCISAMPPGSVAHSRYLCKRLDPQFPELRIVVGLWGWNGDVTRAAARLRSAGADHVITSFAEFLDRVRQVVGGERHLPAKAAS